MTHGQFSVVVALYEVEKYVEAFLQSLHNQTYSFTDLDIVIVDDGSTDESMNVVNAWVQRYPDTIRAISKANGGPGSARNLGLTLAKNSWVTFPDPDDMLHPDYFTEISKYIALDVGDRISLMTSRLVQHVDGSFVTNHKHPLDWKFRSGNRMIDLDANPNFVHLSGGTAFLRRDVIEQHGLRFDEDIRPKFEDAHFIGRYLAVAERPILGLVAKARYFYRKRADGSSLVQSAWSNAGVYDAVPRLGYLGLLRFVKNQKGYVPRWTQAMVLYELVWAYVEQKKMHSPTGAISDQQRLNFLAIFDEIMTFIDANAIEEFAAIGQGWLFHNMLLRSTSSGEPGTPTVVRWGVDAKRELVRFSYVYVGNRPSETIDVNGVPSAPIEGKVVAHEFFGRVALLERVFYVPYGEIRVMLNGEYARISVKPEVPTRGMIMTIGSPRFNAEMDSNAAESTAATTERSTSISSRPSITVRSESRLRSLAIYRRIDDKLTIQSMLQHESKSQTAINAARRVSLRTVSKGVAAWQKAASHRELAGARSNETRSKYRNAWILIDSKDRADDNAEHLYRFLSANRQDINAWFVIERDSRDWNRLEADGFRLLEYGSLEAAAALLYASYNISSHADRAVQYPPNFNRFGEPTAKIVFLQHGVTKDDLSRWLNPKKISLIITATENEYNSIAGDETNYKFSPAEVACTGFPRHDELRKISNAMEGVPRRNILIAPTWRQYLTDIFESDESPECQLSEFEATAFGRNWLGLLRDNGLKCLAEENELRIRFLAHPNLAKMIPALDIPSYVEVLDYLDLSVQRELVASAILVSDFSSLAFEGAIAGANIIHYQFDGNEIFEGGHPYRKGYFDYETQGFGPRLEVLEDVLEELRTLIDNDLKQRDIYASRIEQTFKYADYGNCERTTSAIEALGRPWWQ